MIKKPNKVNNSTSHFIELAFEQAKINLGATGTNPSVGCVVVKNNSIISSGYTSIKGRPHAEYNSLNKNLNFKGASLYVSLEPCSHYGLTPPCTDIIIKKGIKKVYFSLNDVDPRSAKLALEKFKSNKIKVKSGFLKKYAKYFYKSYLDKKKNYLDAKIAISQDYFTINKKSKWISNEYSLKRAHLLRSNYDCIISTSKSINIDNSKLDCRIEGLEHKSPAVVIIDKNYKLKSNVEILKNLKKRRILLFTNKQNQKKEKHFKQLGVKVIKLKQFTINGILQKLNYLGYSRFLLECGLTYLNYAIQQKAVNDLYVFKSSKKLKKSGINNSSNSVIKKIKLKNKIRVNLFEDTLYKENLTNV